MADGACKIKRVKYVRTFQPVKELNQTRQSILAIGDKANRQSSRKGNYADVYARGKSKQKKVGFLDKMAAGKSADAKQSGHAAATKYAERAHQHRRLELAQLDVSAREVVALDEQLKDHFRMK